MGVPLWEASLAGISIITVFELQPSGVRANAPARALRRQENLQCGIAAYSHFGPRGIPFGKHCLERILDPALVAEPLCGERTVACRIQWHCSYELVIVDGAVAR